jgi:zinc and cadmium transporter
MLLTILFFTFLGSLLSLIGGLILLSNEKLMLKISHLLASFAAGVLLGTAFFHLLPEALHEGEALGIDAFLWALVGIVTFFVLERFVHWFHHHEEYHGDSSEPKATVPLIIFGDTVHNFIDGVVIAAAFMIDMQLGIITTFAVAAHEIPQEIGDFGLLLHKGLPRKKIILVNLVSASAAFLGAILTFLAGSSIEGYLPILIALTAGFFIYIASSDLIPEIHHEKRKGFAFYETALLIAGILTIWITVNALSSFHP